MDKINHILRFILCHRNHLELDFVIIITINIVSHHMIHRLPSKTNMKSASPSPQPSLPISSQLSSSSTHPPHLKKSRRTKTTSESIEPMLNFDHKDSLSMTCISKQKKSFVSNLNDEHSQNNLNQSFSLINFKIN